MYILAYKAKRKNAKRHIWGYYNTVNECLYNANHKLYDFSIWTTKWELVLEVK